MALCSNWNTVNKTLSKIQDNDIKNLDAPIDGLGSKYNVNLNFKVEWVDEKGPVCVEELLPAKARDIIHPGKYLTIKRKIAPQSTMKTTYSFQPLTRSIAPRFTKTGWDVYWPSK